MYSSGDLWRQKTEQEGDRLFIRVCEVRIRGNGFKLKESRFRLHIEEKIFYSEGGEALKHVAKRCGWCPIPEDFQGEAGSGPEQPDLPVVSPFTAEQLDLLASQRSLPTLRILWFLALTHGIWTHQAQEDCVHHNPVLCYYSAHLFPNPHMILQKTTAFLTAP